MVENASTGFDLHFAAADGSLGGHVGLMHASHAEVMWYWACVVGPGRPLLAVIDHDVPPPRTSGWEIRTTGLWAEIIDQTPGRHLTTGLEAFGLAFADVGDVFGSGRGDRVPLGLDLEWETDAGTEPGAELACLVHGEVLIGHEALELDGWGFRRAIAERYPWPSGTRVRARLDDGTSICADDRHGVSGGIARTVALAAGRFAVEPRCWAPVPVPRRNQPPVRLLRALARIRAEDGRGGWGWVEAVQAG